MYEKCSHYGARPYYRCDESIDRTKLKQSLGEYKDRVYSSKDRISRKKARKEYEKLDSTVENILEATDVLKEIHVRYVLSEPTIEALDEREQEVHRKLRKNQFQAACFLDEYERVKPSIRGVFRGMAEFDVVLIGDQQIDFYDIRHIQIQIHDFYKWSENEPKKPINNPFSEVKFSELTEEESKTIDAFINDYYSDGYFYENI
ncbi:MAG: hypothetical protein E7E11_12785 [Enterococcus faecalis]|nr:hypothetical protein [Enterococcus faecalis]